MSRLPVVFSVATLAVFGTLLVLVATGWAPLHAADVALSAAARTYGLAHPGWTGTLRILTDAGATWSFLAAGSAVAGALAIRRAYPRALAVGLVTVSIPVCWGIAHRWLHRPRPANGFVAVAGNGFPSGHAANATALAALAVLLLWPRLGRAGRSVAVTAAVLGGGFVAASRVALLAHWPSDVVGGALLALGVVPLCVSAGAALTRRPASRADWPG